MNTDDEQSITDESINDSEESDIEAESDDVQQEQHVPQDNMTTNKYWPMLLKNMQYPGSFVYHGLVAERVNSIMNGAEPLVKDDKVDERTMNYEEIFDHVVGIVLQEIKEGVSPLMYCNPITKKEESIYTLDTNLLIDEIEKCRQIAKE